MKKVLLIIFIIFLLPPSFYFYKLHSLAIQGNEIFEERCTKVNPPLITYKKEYLKMIDLIKNEGDQKKIEECLDKYVYFMTKYIEEENKWLDKEKAYIDRWDFKFFQPWYIQHAANYQLEMYKSIKNNAGYFIEFYSGNDSEELQNLRVEGKRTEYEYRKMYFDFLEEAKAINDFRKIFGNVSVPNGCNDENLIIPDTSNVWEGSENTQPSYPETISEESTS